ncbi:hypothetical protein E6Q11_05235 [Candidatus Dojkabacteria bacterium]|uniref:Uncharacterized protein n=1 Tax=Candidatus Dojkabacteria bacterium TaxID=2099670 RepID=A0A5C7J6R4_9BACT|nr:MAG: hypothetical protein E6Q11_05235 [Candidatus Dojkabacteria bacterium]
MYRASAMSTEFNSFYNKTKKELTNKLTAMGCTNLVFDRGYYYMTLFFTTRSGKFGYFFTGDFRDGKFGGRVRMIVRSVNHYKDYSGGTNMPIDSLDTIDKAIARI